jgi:hypothetical protein
MRIKVLHSVGVGFSDEDIDIGLVDTFVLYHQVIRRRDRYIKRFRKGVQVHLRDGRAGVGSVEALPLIRAYVRSEGFRVSKRPVIEMKKTCRGMEECRAIDWTWTRVKNTCAMDRGPCTHQYGLGVFCDAVGACDFKRVGHK